MENLEFKIGALDGEIGSRESCFVYCICPSVWRQAFVQARGSLRRITPHVMKVMPFSVLNHFLAHFCLSSCSKYESGKSWINSISPSM
ncbi:hypothetical protein Hanom_Chr04g00287421 [Helianthus anomalus]